MKLKYNHDGETLSIPLTDTKPAGKSFAVRHNGTTYYAPTVPVSDPFAADCAIVIDGQPCALSKGIAPNSVTLNGATKYNITAEDRQRGVIVTDFSNSVNITGLTFNTIKKCSYSGSTITLVLAGKVKIVLPNATTNALNLNGTIVYVGTNMVFDNTNISNAANVSLTSGNTKGFVDSAATGGYKVDGSYVKTGVTLKGGEGTDKLIDGTGNDSLFGGGAGDTFVYSGGNDTIGDYNSTSTNDVISLASNGMGVLDFTRATFTDKNVILSGTEGNSLTIVNGDSMKIVVIDAGGTRHEYTYSSGSKYGILNEAKTSIALYDSVSSFNLNEITDTMHSAIATIDASAVTTGGGINALDTRSSYLIAGEKGVSLTGGSKNDTFKSGAGNSTLTGGAGTNLFVHEGGRDVITDYTLGGGKVSLANVHNISDVRAVSVNSGVVTLEFGNNNAVILQNIATADTVTFASATDTYGTGYYFENNRVRFGSGRGVTLTTAENYTVGENVAAEVMVIANAGGTIVGGENDETIGGYNVSVSGGGGTDIFVYKGGSMHVANYTNADKISLQSGYNVVSNPIIWDAEVVAPDSPLTKDLAVVVSDGTVNQTITIDNLERKAFTSINFRINDTNTTIPIKYGITEPIEFNSAKSVASIAPQYTSVADFGVIGSESGLDSLGNPVARGTEYYSALVTIGAARDNASIVSNAKANSITLQGGSDNYLVGGIGVDKIFFDGGGGLIADCGIGVTTLHLDDKNKLLATTTTRAGSTSYVEYNRFNTGSYARGRDLLTLNGTVKAIYYDTVSGDDSASINTFDAAIVYTDSNDKTEVILLPDIAKTNTGANTSNTTSLHSVSFNRVVIYDNAHATSLTADDKATLVHDWADFPASLQAQTIKLYNMYNAGGFKNGYASLSPNPQVLPDWIPAKE